MMKSLSVVTTTSPADEPLHRLLNPRSVALIGVSRNPDSFGYPLLEIALKNGFTGQLYPVNPKADSILGLTCYPNIRDIPDEVDVAVIMVSRKFVAQAVEDCIGKGVKGIVMITAGFAEASVEGKRLQDEMVACARERGIRIIGPNTLGYYSAATSLDAIMSGFIKPGPAALISQSGNLTQSLTFPGAQRGLGFRYVVALGNQADVQAHDLIRYFRNDTETRVIAAHIEGLRDGRRFMQEVRATATVKPVLVVKSGRSEKGARVASSHTAAIAGNDALYQAAFRQCGAIAVDSFRALTSALLAFSLGRPMNGRRVCIISEGGGDCAWTSDACALHGLEVPELSAAAQERLRQIIPPNGAVANPIDLAGWQNFVEAAEIALADDGIDGVILVGGFAGNFNISPRDYDKERQCVERMCALLDQAKKPVLIYSYAGYKKSPLTEMLAAHGVPLFLDHHDAVEAMAALAKHHEIQAAMTGRQFEAALPATRPLAASPDEPAVGWLETDAKALLRAYGIPFPEEGLAGTAAAAAALAEKIGFPVAMKVVSPDILHKSDAGCVKLNLDSRADVERAFAEILANASRFAASVNIKGVLVSRMDREPGVEVIIGGLNDPTFGPAIMFGLGGIFVETLKDVAFRICPLDETDAREMIREIKAFPVLAGARGTQAADLDALAKLLLSVSRALLEHPEIRELDLNPVKVHGQGLLALDARIIGTGGSR
jgi:acetyltransferase